VKREENQTPMTLHGWYRFIGISALLDNFGTLSIIYKVDKFVDLEKPL
jgi:hypothetical protein